MGKDTDDAGVDDADGCLLAYQKSQTYVSSGHGGIGKAKGGWWLVLIKGPPLLRVLTLPLSLLAHLSASCVQVLCYFGFNFSSIGLHLLPLPSGGQTDTIRSPMFLAVPLRR